MKEHFKVGSRQSKLALVQTNWVIQTLKETHPKTTFEIVGFTTIGDKILDVALSKIGDKGLFTKELETGLESGEIDFVVHSLKDLPTLLPQALAIAAISKREDPRDAVIFKSALSVKRMEDLPAGSTVGSCSVRRVAQLKRRYPHLSFLDIRGNIDTRLRKLEDPSGPYSAVILAAAGITRMGWEEKIGQYLEWEDCMHAVGQGALGIECRADNEDAIQILRSLNDPHTYFRCIAERTFLQVLQGGCSVPVAVCSEVTVEGASYYLTLRGSVWSLDGSKSVCDSIRQNLKASKDGSKGDDVPNLTSIHPMTIEGFTQDSPRIAADLGTQLAQQLLNQGAQDILNEVKSQILTN